MKFGLEQKHLDVLNDVLIKPLKKRGAKVWIFGSRARGDFKPFSDVDVLYELPNDVVMSLAEIGQLNEALEESSLPYKVDLANVHELAQSYRDNILKDRVQI